MLMHTIHRENYPMRFHYTIYEHSDAQIRFITFDVRELVKHQTGLALDVDKFKALRHPLESVARKLNKFMKGTKKGYTEMFLVT